MTAAELSPLVILLGSSTITTTLMALLKKASTWVSKQKPRVKQLIVVVISFVVVVINHKFGLSLPTDISAWTADGLSGLLVSLGAFGLHNLKSSIETKTSDPAAPATK